MVLSSALKTLLRGTRDSCLQHVHKRTFLYSNKVDVSRSMIAYLQQEIDLRPVAIKRWKKRTEWEQLVKDHKLNPQRTAFLGSDIACAHFIIKRRGAVRFEDIDEWFEADSEGNVPRQIPTKFDPQYKIEAVDASGTDIMYCSFDNLMSLHSLRYLDISNCQNVDDWTLDRLSEYTDTLQYLDISGCEKITERGISTIHKLQHLRRLKLSNTPKIRYKPLVATMLEEVLPNCVVEGVDFNEDISQTDLEQEMFDKYEKRLGKAIDDDLSSTFIGFALAKVKL